MRRLKVAFRPEARIDLENIYHSVLKISQSQATAFGFYNRIVTRREKIGIVPYGARPRDDLEQGLRLLPFEHSAIIAYEVEKDRVRITNIFYGRRDYEAFYLGTSEDDEEAEIEK